MAGIPVLATSSRAAAVVSRERSTIERNDSQPAAMLSPGAIGTAA